MTVGCMMVILAAMAIMVERPRSIGSYIVSWLTIIGSIVWLASTMMIITDPLKTNVSIPVALISIIGGLAFMMAGVVFIIIGCLAIGSTTMIMHRSRESSHQSASRWLRAMMMQALEVCDHPRSYHVVDAAAFYDTYGDITITQWVRRGLSA
jgi:hypothetical protein